MAQSLPPLPLSRKDKGEERGCFCLKHKWLLHRNSRCQVKLWKMSMEMKKKNRPLILSGAHWHYISKLLSPWPAVTKLLRSRDPPGPGGTTGSLAWGYWAPCNSVSKPALCQGSVTGVDPDGHVLGTSLGTSYVRCKVLHMR